MVLWFTSDMCIRLSKFEGTHRQVFAVVFKARTSTSLTLSKWGHFYKGRTKFVSLLCGILQYVSAYRISHILALFCMCLLYTFVLTLNVVMLKLSLLWYTCAHFFTHYLHLWPHFECQRRGVHVCAWDGEVVVLTQACGQYCMHRTIKDLFFIMDTYDTYTQNKPWWGCLNNFSVCAWVCLCKLSPILYVRLQLTHV